VLRGKLRRRQHVRRGSGPNFRSSRPSEIRSDKKR
jgi:hypothetical protein